MKKLLTSVRYTVIATVFLLTNMVAITPAVHATKVGVTICHATDAPTNPYTNPTVDADSADGDTGNDNGQGDHSTHTGPVATSQAVAQALKDNHAAWGDIIPPHDNYLGLNWTAEGQAIYNNGCAYVVPPTQVTPADVTFHDVCGTENDSFTVPTKTGVIYSETAGVHNGATGSVTVNATAAPSYTLTGTTSWSHSFSDDDEECPVELPHATPADVTFNDVCGTKDDSYTVPTTEGVDYSETAGTHTGATGSVTVNATAQQGYILDGTTSWSHDFTNEDCTTPGHGGGEVLGISTTTPATPAQPQLANTGDNPVANAIIGLTLFVLATGTALIGRRANG